MPAAPVLRRPRAHLNPPSVGLIAPDEAHLTVLADNGCPDLGITSCLACPLPLCREELDSEAATRFVRAVRRPRQQQAIVQGMAEGTPGRTLAEELRITRRTLYRLGWKGRW